MKAKSLFLSIISILVLSSCAHDIVDFTGDIKGVVKDYTYGHMISNCIVTLSPGGMTYTTSDDGMYEFTDLEQGDYTLIFRKAGYADKSESVQVIAGQISNKDCLLKANDPFAVSEQEYDFGDLADNKTFYLYNNSSGDCAYTITNIPEWLRFNKTSGSVSAGNSDAISVTVNRDAVAIGLYTQTVTVSYSGAAQGSVPIKISMSKVQKGAPSVTTSPSAQNVTTSGFDISGNITATGGEQITEYGHCWGTSPNPTTSGNRTNLGMTNQLLYFTSNVTGLSPNVTYYVRAYAKNAYGIAYGDQVAVVTQGGQSNKWDGSAAKGFEGGSGSKNDPYIIKTGGQLVLMKQYKSSYFKLESDIDLDNNSWPAIELSGDFDGNNHTIYNLKITRKEENLGFISKLYGKIKNLTINGVVIEGSGYNNIGGFVGESEYGGDVDNCTLILNANSKILGSVNVGGIIGYQHDVPKDQTIHNLTVKSTNPGNAILGANSVGGLIGSASIREVTVTNCHVEANISGEDCTGGLIGYASGLYMNITDCSYCGNLSGTYGVGGIYGYGGLDNVITSCKVDATITVSEDYAGGISGGPQTDDIIAGCYVTGTMNCENSRPNSIAGLGSGSYSYATCSYSTMTSSNASFIGLTREAMDCACVAPKAGESLSNCQASCTDITAFMRSTYSEYSDLFNFQNTWMWSGKIGGQTKIVSCPKLAWE